MTGLDQFGSLRPVAYALLACSKSALGQSTSRDLRAGEERSSLTRDRWKGGIFSKFYDRI